MRIKILIVFLLVCCSAKSTTITNGVLASADATGLNATARGVTITEDVNINAGKVIATNAVVIQSLTPSKPAVVGADNSITNGVINLAGADVTGTLPDGNTASTIARDTEVAAAIAALTSLYQAKDVDHDSIAAGITGLVIGLGNGNGYSLATAGTHYVAPATTITAGPGLSGGGDLSTGRTFTLDGSTYVNNFTMWDGSQATRTLTMNVSGATKPVFTAANNSLSLNVPLILPVGAAAAPSYGFTGLSGVGLYTESLGIGFATASTLRMFVANNGLIQTRGNGLDLSGAGDTILIRDTAGVAKITSNGTTLAGFKAAQVTLTGANDTTALTVNAGTVTGSGTSSFETHTGTWNTSGHVTGFLWNVTNTASGGNSLIFDFQLNNATRLKLTPGGTLTAAQNLIAGDSSAIGFSDTWISRPSAAVLAVQGALRVGLQSTPAVAATIASAATIAPTARITFISGTTTIDTITAPSPISTTGGQITLIPTGVFATSTSGNIALITTAVVNKALIMTYDATTTKWYPSY